MSDPTSQSASGSTLVANRDEMRDTRLPNGIRVLTESIPGVRSVTAGVWIRQGSAHESPGLFGASHLLEHLVFKGTERRDAKEIALSLERLGGSLDAFTSREHTSFQARVLPEHLPVALDVLADLVAHPVLRDSDLALEREVVLEEISAMEDTPDDLVFELHGERLWGGHPYGRSILGSRESVSGMRAETLAEVHRSRYLNGEMIVGAAGFLDHDAFACDAAAKFGDLPGGRGLDVANIALETSPVDVSVARDGQQTHLVFGARTPPRSDSLRFPLVLLSARFGGGMGSQLFQKVREELGLAYTVYSFQSFYSRAGVVGVYVGTRPEWADRAVDVVRSEYRKLSEGGLTGEELEEVKNQVKGQVMLSLESTGSRLSRLVSFALYEEPLLTLDELLARIEAVTLEQVAEAADRFFDPDGQVLVRLGPAGVSAA
jgi:predicted Zn-dependent peptidase